MSEPFPLLTRRPIFNNQLKVIGYDLVCHSSQKNHAGIKEGGVANKERGTVNYELLVNTFTEIPVRKIVGQQLAFIHYTRSLLKKHTGFDHQQIVIKVTKSTQLDASMLHALKVLREQNYRIAFNKFVLTPETQHLIPYADIIHLDTLQLSPKQLAEHIRDIQPFGIQLLATNITSYKILEFCKTLGFDLFEGDFFRHPKSSVVNEISEYKHALLQLISGIHNPDAQIEKIEKLVARDAALSSKLLNIVNSAAFGATQKVESLRQAIMLLGINKIKNWVNILVLSNIGEKPHELSIAAMVRAHMCELISCRLKGNSTSDTFFTVGLLSTLDAFLDTSLDVLLAKLALKESMMSAILNHTGAEGRILKDVMHYEKGDWNQIDWEHLEANNISAQALTHIYLDTLKWVETAMTDMGMQDR
jgi:c-di-GMP phosphodiesterase